MNPTIGATPVCAQDPDRRIPVDVSAHLHRSSAGRQAGSCHNGRGGGGPASLGAPGGAGGAGAACWGRPGGGGGEERPAPTCPARHSSHEAPPEIPVVAASAPTRVAG